MRAWAVGMAASLLALMATPAIADTAPPSPSTPATVSADALPTVQINGVVWSQVTVGTTVYATGSFTQARPAGSAAGSNETPRGNLLAYDLTTGDLLKSFDHSLNGTGQVVTASPDGTTLYVGGDFTTVDGKAHQRLAAFSTSTGALIDGFAVTANDSVRGVSASNTAVWFGGKFTTVNGTTRTRLAEVAAGTGALQPWAPVVNDYLVRTVLLTPSQARVLVGGQFTQVNGTATPGLAALDPTTGAVQSWAATSAVHNSGSTSGILSLRTDGTLVYATGFAYNANNDGKLEGAFAADPDTGTLRWIEDCHGDSYDTFPVGQVLYLVSHAHDCSNIGAFPQSSPVSYYRATAFTTAATGTVAHNTVNPAKYTDWYGQPAPTQLDWYPTLATGSYTGQNQAAWSVTGNSSYLALGGEFPTVNGTAQQGLVRFAIKPSAPNKVGPTPSSGLTPTVTSTSPGSAQITFTATYDRDNQALTYQVVRDGHTDRPLFTTTVSSTFWNLPPITYTDSTQPPGSKHAYRIYVTDPFGNSNSGSSTVVTLASTPT